MFRGTNLVAVIAAPKHDHGRVRLLTVEMYEDGVIVRYVLPDAFPPHESETRETWQPVSLSLSDDAGTAYEFERGGGSSADGAPLRGDAVFTPAVPRGARRLMITTESEAVEVELDR